jgi:hypothetical protein
MKNEWLEDFRSELYSLGNAIWDYQEGVPGALPNLRQKAPTFRRKVWSQSERDCDQTSLG